MANVQAQFEEFNQAIRLGKFDENATLREKRDIIRKKLEDNLPGVFAKYGETCPDFYFLDQGSYAMDTGTKPLDGDYDIDQGLYFCVSSSIYPDPVVLKERVHEALFEHTNDVQLRRSCVTVFYSREGESIYHVDIAVYSDGSENADGKSRLAKGKLHSAPENRFWEVSNPQKLNDTIFERFVGEDRAQFRRIVRYEKRWKAVNFTVGGGAAPNGIGLTIMTYNDLQACYADPLTKKPNDLSAMRALIEKVLTRFIMVYDENEQRYVERLVVLLPVEPGNDLFERMTAKQMADFKVKLTTLRDALVYADGVSDPVAACERLRQVFGSEFPVPNKSDTATSQPRAITSSGNSA
jgi:hypothetical protein